MPTKNERLEALEVKFELLARAMEELHEALQQYIKELREEIQK